MAQNEIAFEVNSLIRVYKSGKIDRFVGELLPAGLDTTTGVQSKDISIPESAASVRLYIPKITDHNRKLPLLVYIHGGGFVTESNASMLYHPHVNSLVANCNVIAASLEYRVAPEHRLPAAYDDSWTAIQWIAEHSNGTGSDPWLNQYADFQNVYFAGDSAGANISHHMAIRIGSTPIRFKLVGMVLIHPYFGGIEPLAKENIQMKSICDNLWMFSKPDSSGSDDPEFNPDKDPRISTIVCKKILVCVAGKDILRERGWNYREVMRKSGWKGRIEVVEDEDENHCFYLLDPNHEKVPAMIKRFDDFINQI